jgi:hypothetical protein
VALIGADTLSYWPLRRLDQQPERLFKAPVRFRRCFLPLVHPTLELLPPTSVKCRARMRPQIF